MKKTLICMRAPRPHQRETINNKKLKNPMSTFLRYEFKIMCVCVFFFEIIKGIFSYALIRTQALQATFWGKRSSWPLVPLHILHIFLTTQSTSRWNSAKRQINFFTFRVNTLREYNANTLQIWNIPTVLKLIYVSYLSNFRN